MLNLVSEFPASKERRSNKERRKEQNLDKNIFLRDLEMSSIKELLLKEIDIPKLKESLVEDIKESLLQEIDVSGIKEVLTQDITIRGLSSNNDESIASNEVVESVASEVVGEKVNLPAYRYGLTESLIEDHQELLSIYESIMESAKAKEYAMLPMMLSKFSKKCLSHFNEEEELFIFMTALAKSRSEIERKVAREFAVEMKNLSVDLFTVLNQSHFIPVMDNTVDGFIKEFEGLGSVLQERISREEKILFPMYENSRKVIDIC